MNDTASLALCIDATASVAFDSETKHTKGQEAGRSWLAAAFYAATTKTCLQ